MRNIETLLTSETIGPCRSINTPVYLSSTYGFNSIEEAETAFLNDDEHVYSRIGNPTVEEFETKMSMIECDLPSYGCAFSSGMAAISSIIMTECSPGDVVLCVEEVYGGTWKLLEQLSLNYGIKVQTFPPDLYFDPRSIDKNVKIILVETPTNPSLHKVDLEKLNDILKFAGLYGNITRCVDNTFATPLYQQPLMDFNADVVIHSSTKYIGGHGDLIGGVVVSDYDSFIERLRETRTNMGCIMSPFTAFLCLRGLKTLSVRMERHTQNATALYSLLTVGGWSTVKKVEYPGFSGMLSVEFESRYSADDFVRNLEIPIVAVSLGETKTLINVPSCMTHKSYSDEELKKLGISPGLVRISVGIENKNDLLHDFSKSLELLERG